MAMNSVTVSCMYNKNKGKNFHLTSGPNSQRAACAEGKLPIVESPREICSDWEKKLFKIINYPC